MWIILFGLRAGQVVHDEATEAHICGDVHDHENFKGQVVSIVHVESTVSILQRECQLDQTDKKLESHGCDGHHKEDLNRLVHFPDQFVSISDELLESEQQVEVKSDEASLNDGVGYLKCSLKAVFVILPYLLILDVPKPEVDARNCEERQ